MGIHRNQDGNFSDEVWENWTKFSRKDIHRKGPPARLLVTLFGMLRTDHRPDSMKLTGEIQSSSLSPRSEFSEEPVAKRHCPDNLKKLSLEPTSQDPHAIESSVDASMPKNLPGADHGPKFRKFDVQ